MDLRTQNGNRATKEEITENGLATMISSLIGVMLARNWQTIDGLMEDNALR